MISKLDPAWQRAPVLEAVFDQLADAIVLYDREMVITGVNQAAEKLFGITAGEMIGRSCKEVFRCVVCEPDCGVLVGINQNGPVPRCTVRLRSAAGRERLAVMRTSHVHDADGAVQGVVATVTDITDEADPKKREIVAESRAMRDVLNFMRRVAVSEATTIMLEGENGTGKDLIAKTLHYESMRQAEPFIAINCAAIPETLLESELFGYEKGAFTDARSQKRGIFELADKGTLFLDEIGEMPLSLQAKLLRVLEEQSFRRLGGLKDINLDLRVITATNKNLREAVKEGAFRQDLYFRLNVIQISLPPLREHPEDILPMTRFFIEHYNRKFRRQIEGISPAAEHLLMMHSWPGNVRELRNAVERAMILEETSQLTPNGLPVSLGNPGAGNGMHPHLTLQIPDEGISLEENERNLVVRALEKTAGNQTQAARVLSITRDTLRYKMKKFNLK
jgi:PAS domain S-box-containing protein